MTIGPWLLYTNLKKRVRRKKGEIHLWRRGCFALYSTFSHDDIQDSAFIPASTEGKPELTEKQPKIKASFKVIPFANNIAD